MNKPVGPENRTDKESPPFIGVILLIYACAIAVYAGWFLVTKLSALT